MPPKTDKKPASVTSGNKGNDTSNASLPKAGSVASAAQGKNNNPNANLTAGMLSNSSRPTSGKNKFSSNRSEKEHGETDSVQVEDESMNNLKVDKNELEGVENHGGFVDSVGLETQGMIQDIGANKQREPSKYKQMAEEKLRLEAAEAKDGSMQDPHNNSSAHIDSQVAIDQSASKIDMLKQNLNSLEAKVKGIRDARQKKKNEIIEQQTKMNKELSTIVKSSKNQIPEDELNKVVQEQAHHRPNSLTKENIKLKQENERLKELLADRQKEIDKMSLELKNVRKNRDDCLDRIEELSKIIENRHRSDEREARERGFKGVEHEENVRQERVGWKLELE